MKDAEIPGAASGGEPSREIENDSGVESRLEGAQQKPQKVKCNRIGSEDHGDAGYAPSDRDRGNYPSRAQFPLEQYRRNAESDIAEKEKSCAEPVDCFPEVQIRQHLQLGKGNICPVDPCQQPQTGQNWDDSPLRGNIRTPQTGIVLGAGRSRYYLVFL